VKLSILFLCWWFWSHLSAIKEGWLISKSYIQNNVAKSYLITFVESLLVVRDLGIQLKTTYNTGRSQSKFIDKGKILELIINEGITLFQVKFYLAVLVEGEDKMSVVFEVRLRF
jgi:hypothetical protein